MQFNSLIKKTFDHIVDVIDFADNTDEIEVDSTEEIIQLLTPVGLFIINRHSILGEIWLVSPISGPYHFRYVDGSWIAKGGVSLLDLLSTELKIKF